MNKDIFSGDAWASSKNEFADTECPNLGAASVNNLQGCKDACLENQSCTAFNYNAATKTCFLRGCKSPVVAPTFDRYGGYDGFWLSSSGIFQWTYIWVILFRAHRA